MGGSPNARSSHSISFLRGMLIRSTTGKICSHRLKGAHPLTAGCRSWSEALPHQTTTHSLD